MGAVMIFYFLDWSFSRQNEKEDNIDLCDIYLL